MCFVYFISEKQEFQQTEEAKMRTCTFACVLAICMIAVVPTFGTEIGPGPVFGDWDASGNPFNVNGEIYIPTDSTLIIHPGVNVIFQAHYKLNVYGYLEALGVEGDSITFDAANPTIGWHGIRFISSQDSSHLSYCIIQHGRALGAESDPNSWGGGIFCNASNPVITHCAIRSNYAQWYAGGIEIINSSSPIIFDCDIKNNSAYQSGAVDCYSSSNPVISNCNILNNTSASATGGLSCASSSSTIISNCDISGNNAVGNGGGMLFNSSSNPIITNCTITGNSAGMDGGGIRIAPSTNPVITGCTISGNSAEDDGGGISCEDCANPVVSNCDIIDNSAGEYGGGIELYNNANLELSYCTISENTAALYSGGIECVQSAPTITNCTITGNTATTGSGGGMSTYQASPAVKNTIIESNIGDGLYCYESPGASFTYCDIWNNDIVGCPSELGVLADTNANGDSCDIYMNILSDPLFYAISGDSAFYLTEDSPCIDAGDPTSPLDPDGTITDIGRYYYHQTPSAVEPLASAQPSQFLLFPNYPNPFNASTVLRYSLLQPGTVTLTVRNILGQEVATLFDGRQQPGVHAITWNASDVSSGIYFARLDNGIQTSCTKMILLK